MANKNPLPDERVVYLALKPVFKGQNAEMRKDKAVRKLIRKHEAQKDVADLVREHNFEVICNTARTLLCEEVFASTLKAKIRFPELFDVSPNQSAEREASEAEAARVEAGDIENAVQGRRDAPEPDISGPSALDATQAEKAQCGRLPSTWSALKEPVHATLPPQGPSTIPPLFPVYLPFEAQHRVLVHLQTLLELSCFKFGNRKMQQMLQQRGWDCAESVELSRWTEEFAKRENLFPAAQPGQKPLDQLLRSIANIRHSAVHRIRVSAKSIEQFLLDAEAFAVLLVDADDLEQIAKLRRKVQAITEELERNKHFLRSRLDETLRGIAAKREELRRLEEAAIAEMEREDTEYQMLAGRSVGRVVAPSEASFSTAIDTEKDTTTGLDDTDDMDDENDTDKGEDAWDTKIPSAEDH